MRGTAKAILVLAPIALLGACTNDESGEDRFAGLGPVDISTAQGAYQAVLPAYSMRVVYPGSGNPRSLLTFDGHGYGEPDCDTGSTSYDGQFSTDVDSPFSDELFDMSRYEDRNCVDREPFEDGESAWYLDGPWRRGCPVSEGETCSVEYLSLGDSSTPFVLNFSLRLYYYDYQYRFETTGLVRTHRQVLDGSTDYRVHTEFDALQARTGEVTRRWSGRYGTAGEPFRTVYDPAGSIVAGSYAFLSDDHPGCALGVASVTTLVPLTSDPSTGEVAGTLQVTAGARTATVERRSDGTVEVTSEGEVQALTVEQVRALQSACPRFSAFY
jgi:hypothetical protein